MKAAARGLRGPRGTRRAGDSREWIGGRFSPPIFIEGRNGPYRAETAVWLELPSGLVVGQDVMPPEEAAGAVARLLRTAMASPLAGPPRRPDRIRVSDTSLAAEIRAAIDDAIPLVVAPTPELDRLSEELLEFMPEADAVESYLEGGRIVPAAVGELFRAAELLYHVAPWKLASDDRVLRMDIPALGVKGACVSIIGALGQSRGVLVFPSLRGCAAFRRAAEKGPSRNGLVDLGTGWLSLGFERRTDLPPSMRREATAHGWPVAGAHAWPVVERWDRDGVVRPLVERDLKIAAACASALAAFVIKHGELFGADAFEPVCESFQDDQGLVVRFTLPYEALPLFDVESNAPSRAAYPVEKAPVVRRNDPCPCGSGRKYKKCCTAERRSAPRGEGDPHHTLDARWVDRLTEFARSRFGSAWRAFGMQFANPLDAQALAVPWSVYGYRVRDATVLDRYLEEHAGHLSPADREWLFAQRAAWLSIWEVTAVEPGAAVTLRDLLSHETRRVREVSASRTLVVRDTLLARVVDLAEMSLLCGVHPRPLPPIDGAYVARRARGRLRRKGAVPAEKLREAAFGPYLIRQWEQAVARLDALRAIPPILQNTDGDPLLQTTDHFRIAPGAGADVFAGLAALENVRPPEVGEDPPAFVFLRPDDAAHSRGEATVVGVARLSGAMLRVETNSTARADALRARIEAACGERLRHRAREHADPQSSKRRHERPEKEPEPVPAELRQVLTEFKQQHYARWCDESIPALGGRTPREAVRTASGRAAVDVLLKDIENRERRFPDGSAVDFARIRRELRLE